MKCFEGNEMHKWNITDKRREYIVKQLRKQSTLQLIWSDAFKSEVTYEVFVSHVKKAGISWKEENRNGMLGLKKRLFDLTSTQITEKDEFDATLKFLSRYEKLDEDTDDTANDTVDVDIRLKIMNDLNG